MNFEWIGLLLFLLYIVPELFKRRPKKYEYPEIPQPVPAPAEQAPAPTEEKIWSVPLPQPKANAAKPMSEIAPPMQILNIDDHAAAAPWQGNVSREAVINGLIYAEILQPPRAKRPLGR